VMAVMDQQALAVFGELGGAPGLPASTSAAALGEIARITKAAAAGRWDGRAPVLARTVASAAEVIPPDLWGNTYRYNTTTEEYEVAADPGPDQGIRIILYAWNVLEGKPSTPLTEIGHVDLIDQSTTQQNQLHVIVRKSDGATLADYLITHSVTGDTESFSISGDATNGTTAVEFGLSGTMNANVATVNFDLDAPSVGFKVHVDVNVNALTESGTINVRLEYDGHRLTFALTAGVNTMSAEINYDGYRYVTYTMTYDPATGTTTETVRKANGRPITIPELDQLQLLFERALDFGGFWEALLWPLGVLPAAT
jgi:hypothetical protein